MIHINPPTVIEALLPDPANFKLIYNGRKVLIKKFHKIVVQFGDRISVVVGAKNVIKFPLITYYIALNDAGRECFLTDTPSSNDLCLKKRSCFILLGLPEYSFRGFVSYIPRSLCNRQPNVYKEDIIVEIDLDKIDTSIYDKTMPEFYKEYQSRYEIMEIN